MKTALVCSHGGHLTQMLRLIDAFKDQENFFVTYDSNRTRHLAFKKYLLKNIGINPIRMISESFKILIVLIKEKPELIVSTGSEIAIPAIYFGKLLRIKTIYIESWTRVTTASGTGKLVYPVSDIFLVQWPELLNTYGSKAQYKGAVI